LKRVAPWAVAFGLLAWLFHTVPVHELEAALRAAPLRTFVGLTVVYVIGTLLADTFATWATFRSSLPEANLRFGEALDVRGASYLLAILHYGAGQGGMAYFVNRVHGVALARAAGSVMLLMGVNVIVVALVALVGVLAGGAPANPTLRLIVFGLACGFPAYLAVVAARPRFLARRALLAPLFEAGIRGHAVATAARLPHIVWLMVGHLLAMRLFGVIVPVPAALTLIPLLFVVTVLPIAPSGIGTAQATAVALFAPFALGGPALASQPAREAAVLAYGLALQFGALILQAGIGLAFLRRVSKAVTVGKASPNSTT
jgi:uncharacterized membrane protein YbhN (UPF0104 family)